MKAIGNFFTNILATTLATIMNFYTYDPKRRFNKLIFWSHILLTIIIVAMIGAGIALRTNTQNQMQQVSTNNQFSSSGQFTVKNRKKEYQEAVKAQTEAFKKYGQNSKQYSQAQQKVFQLQSADQQVTKPSDPGKSIHQSLQEIVDEYGTVSNSQLAKDYRNKIYLSSGELQWMYEHKLLSDLGIQGGQGKLGLGFDIYSGTLYVGVIFNDQNLKQKFETIATLMYKNSDVAPRTDKLTFQYMNREGQFPDQNSSSN